MRTVLHTLIVVSLLLLGCASKIPPLSQPKPPNLAKDVAKAVVMVLQVDDQTGEVHTCTGFSVGPKLILTAAHCVGMFQVPVSVDGDIAGVMRVDRALDLALLTIPQFKPSLSIRPNPPTWGESVNGMGFGLGLGLLVITQHRVELTQWLLNPGESPGIVYLNPFYPGMSGGPVYDGAGLVVGMVQKSSREYGFGVGSDVLNFFLTHGK